VVPFKHSNGMHCTITKEKQMTIYSKTLGKGKYGMHDAEAQNYILHTAARLNLAAVPSQRRALFCSSTHGSQLATRNHP
jgi:hypothetical protein